VAHQDFTIAPNYFNLLRGRAINASCLREDLASRKLFFIG